MQLLYSSIQRMRTVKCQVLLKEKGESSFGEAVIQKKFNDDVKMHLKVCRICTKIFNLYIVLENTLLTIVWLN